MHILRLLQLGNSAEWKSVLYVTCLAGLANAVLIGLINLVAENAALAKPVGLRLMALYVIAFAIYYTANRASLSGANDFLQQRLGELRLSLADKIRHSQLLSLDQVGRGVIFATVAQETNHLSQNFPLLVSAGQSMFLLVFCLLYVATLSFISFIVVTIVTALALMIFWLRRQKLAEAMVTVNAHEAAMLESLSHFEDGFKEIRLNANKNDALFTHFNKVVSSLENVVVGIGRDWVVLLLFSNAFLYGLLGVVIFVLPSFFAGYTDIIYKIAAAAIFCVGPVTAVTSVAPIYGRANIGLWHVFRLGERLDEGVMEHDESEAPSPFRGFQKICFENITFNYLDAAGNQAFGVGPWNIEIGRAEIVFLLGGNGSGKSTAMKLLCGLYPIASGRIVVDGVPLDDESMQQFRELFACIFPDFHLFERLHGLDHVDPAEVHALIQRMELGAKVSFADGRFSTQDLSTGQRKRLAMIVSILEDRDIYLFDEWAADQDAHFRDVFYTELLPQFKQRGKTVLVVTHDDRYWGCCDRVITFDLGMIVPSYVHPGTTGA